VSKGKIRRDGGTKWKLKGEIRSQSNKKRKQKGKGMSKFFPARNRFKLGFPATPFKNPLPKGKGQASKNRKERSSGQLNFWLSKGARVFFKKIPLWRTPHPKKRRILSEFIKNRNYNGGLAYQDRTQVTKRPTHRSPGL